MFLAKELIDKMQLKMCAHEEERHNEDLMSK